MDRVLSSLRSAWRFLLTPRSVRVLEDHGIHDAVRSMPRPAPDDPWAGLSESERRNRELEERMQDLARLYEDRPEDRGG